MTTVLVTCVGSGVGQSVVDSLNLKREFRIIGCDGNPHVYAHSFCDHFFVVPGLYSEGYVDYILNLCVENEVAVLIPGHDHELVLFARDYDKFKSKGIEVVVSEPKIIAVSRDKQAWYDFFAPLGCKIVPTISVKEFLENPDTSIFPAIVKPSGGSASQGIFIINELPELVGLNPDDIIQPYLFPEESDKNYQNIYNAVKKGNFLQMSEISIQLIFNKNAKFSGIFISKNSLKSGVPVFVDPINPEEFEYTAEILKFVPILEQYGVKGPVNIQGRVTPKGLFFFEMNMRFTGITGNRALLGFNEVDYLVRDALGMETTRLDAFSYNKVGARQVACTTISRQTITNKTKKTISILGGGSEVGKYFINEHYKEFEKIFIISRKINYGKYQETFLKYDNATVVCEEDINAMEYLCQSDVFVNFVSALAYQEDKDKFDAVRYVYYWITKVTKAKIPFVVNISSQSVYQQDLNELKDESYPVQYNKAYAFQKVIIEDFISNIKAFSVNSTVLNLRVARILNPMNTKQTGFFGQIVDKVKKSEEFAVAQPNNNTNLIHIKDVVNAILFFVNYPERTKLPEIINLGGENTTVKKYVETVEEILNINANVLWGDEDQVLASSCLNVEKLNGLGFKATKSLKEIIIQINKAL